MPSKLYEACEKCAFKDNCNQKRMVEVGYLPFPSMEEHIPPSVKEHLNIGNQIIEGTIDGLNKGKLTEDSLNSAIQQLDKKMRCEIK